ncbi:MAG: GNAT family N-acetyltransferase [Candidatus Eiseniibacteriota bacterium]
MRSEAAAGLDRARILAVERVEILAKLDGVEGAPKAAQELGLLLRRVGGAWAFACPRDHSLSINRVMGFGLERPGTPGDLGALKVFYAEHEIPGFRISLCPAAEPAGVDATLVAAGFGVYTHWIKWVRDGSPAKTAATELRVERAGPDEAESIDELLFAAFGHRPYSVPCVAALVGRRYWHHYVIRDGGSLIASGSMYAREGFAWLGAAATLASHRGRGAQAALIARRIDDARALGCHTFTTETEPDQPEGPNASSRNMERAGFRIVYRRPSWACPNPGHA